MSASNFPCLPILVCLLLLARSDAQETLPFSKEVAPFLQTFCVDCHGGTTPEGGLSFEDYGDSGQVQTDFEVWEKTLRVVSEGQMPPKDAEQPTPKQRLRAIAGIEAELGRFDCDLGSSAGRVTLRRLNRSQYNNTIRDLIGIDFQPAKDFPSDDVGEGFDNIGAVLSLSPILLEKYLTAAETIATRATDDEKVRRRLFPHQPGPNLSKINAARANLRDFVSRAFRRPATDDEVERLWELIKLARDHDASEIEQIQIVIQAVLTSPNFLFLVEADPTVDQADEEVRNGDVSKSRALNGYEIASRLSYFIWSSMPDEALFALAAKGRLQDPDVLREQTLRMFADPKATAFVDNFAGQWLQLRSLQDVQPDQNLFPKFDARLRQAMEQETKLFFKEVVAQDRSLLDFLQADYTYVNDVLAKHYGIEGVDGKQFRRVSLGDRRRGVLTHASILLITSNPTRTSPVKRGKWILDNILGEPPPPPPEGVEELDDATISIGSLRQRMEQHRSNEACAVCHRKMDTLGFGLENFDVTGAWRTHDGRFEIDPSGKLPGGKDFRTPRQLMEILATQKKTEFCRCLTNKMLTYALGRGLTANDRCAVNEIQKQLIDGDYRFSQLVTAIVVSEPFRRREIKQSN